MLVVYGLAVMAGVTLLTWWAKPVNGQLSPRLRARGMEITMTTVISIGVFVGLGLILTGLLPAK
jgi:hypothetical protein